MSDKTWNRLGRTEALLPCRRDPCVPGPPRDAQFARPVVRRRHAVDHGRLHQRHDGAHAGLRGRHAARRAADHGLRGPDVLHRGQLRRRLPDAVPPDELVPYRQHGAGGPGPRVGEVVLLRRRRCVSPGRALDHRLGEGILAEGAGRLPRQEGDGAPEEPTFHAGFGKVLQGSGSAVLVGRESRQPRHPATSAGTRRSTSSPSGPASTASWRWSPRGATMPARSTAWSELVHDLNGMPGPMRQLALAQMFTWFALFASSSTRPAAVTSYHFGSTDPRRVPPTTRAPTGSAC
jgi:hypothetical protein